MDKIKNIIKNLQINKQKEKNSTLKKNKTSNFPKKMLASSLICSSVLLSCVTTQETLDYSNQTNFSTLENGTEEYWSAWEYLNKELNILANQFETYYVLQALQNTLQCPKDILNKYEKQITFANFKQKYSSSKLPQRYKDEMNRINLFIPGSYDWNNEVSGEMAMLFSKIKFNQNEIDFTKNFLEDRDVRNLYAYYESKIIKALLKYRNKNTPYFNSQLEESAKMLDKVGYNMFLQSFTMQDDFSFDNTYTF